MHRSGVLGGWTPLDSKQRSSNISKLGRKRKPGSWLILVPRLAVDLDARSPDRLVRCFQETSEPRSRSVWETRDSSPCGLGKERWPKDGRSGGAQSLSMAWRSLEGIQALRGTLAWWFVFVEEPEFYSVSG
jgi:hypothetical protein